MLRLVACGTHPVGTTQFVPYCGYHTICAHPVDEHKLWDLFNYLECKFSVRRQTG